MVSHESERSHAFNRSEAESKSTNESSIYGTLEISLSTSDFFSSMSPILGLWRKIPSQDLENHAPRTLDPQQTGFASPNAWYRVEVICPLFRRIAINRAFFEEKRSLFSNNIAQTNVNIFYRYSGFGEYWEIINSLFGSRYFENMVWKLYIDRFWSLWRERSWIYTVNRPANE